MPDTVIQVVVPLFGLMVVGFLAGRFHWMPRDGSAILGRFVFVIALPALVFISLSRVSVAEFFDWRFLGVLGGGMLAIMVVGVLVSRLVFRNGLADTGMHALSVMFSSTGYIGLPLILGVFGNQALVPGIVGAVITGAVFMPIAIVFAELERGQDRGGVLLAPLIGVARNPLLLATVAGLSVSAMGVGVPKLAATLCQFLADAYVPCAMFSAGLFMSRGFTDAGRAEIGWMVLAKLALHPLITWLLAVYVFELRHTLMAVAVLQAALPAGVPVFVLAQHYGTFVARSNAVIVISTGLSIFSLLGILVFVTR
jgi:malonate transporter